MASEIRVNSLTNRSGLSTVSITDAGLNAVGIITAHNFKTGTTDVHSTGVTAGDGVFTGNVSVTGNLNVSGALTYEDVTNVDAVGLSTFRNGIHVTGGSVGIGTDAPAAGSKLHLHDTSACRIQLTTDSTGHTLSDGTRLMVDSSNNFEILNRENANIELFTNNTERLRITSAGRMGLGTNDPAALLEVRDSENATQGNAQIRISKGVGGGAAPTSVSRANSYLHIGGSEYHTSFGKYNIAFGYTNDEVGSGIPAYIGFVETNLSGYTLGDLVFGTRENTNATGNPAERLRITSTGVINCGHGDEINLHGSTTTGINLNGNGNSGQIIANASGNRALIIGRQASYGQVIEFFQGTNTNEAAITIPAADSFGIETAGTERLRIDSAGRLMLGQISAYSASGTGTMMLTVTKNATSRTDAAISNQNSGDNASAALVLATHGQDYILEATGSGNTTDGTRAFRILKGTDERLRIDTSGNKYTNAGAIGHGSGDHNNFASAGRTTYNNVSLRAGQHNAGTTPTNTNSVIKIYPAGVRSTTTGNLTGGIAWQHLDPDNGSWDSTYGAGAQIWMGAALHDTPGQERDRFNLWMNSQTSGNSNPNQLAIEAYPNGMVRHPKVPAFHVSGGTTLTASTNNVIISPNVDFNNGNHYSTSNGRFTAPIDGYYKFSFWGLLYSHGSGVINIFYSINGNQYADLVQGGADSNSHTSRSGTVMMSMSAGDYAELRINPGSSGAHAYSSQWNMCGFLVG